MTLLTAPKASNSLFRPDYDTRKELDDREDDLDPTNDILDEPRMGWEKWLSVETEEGDKHWNMTVYIIIHDYVFFPFIISI